MGLDMYLYGKEMLWDKPDITDAISNFLNTPFSPISITFEVGYWRKANAIHKFFVDNAQEGIDDCGEYRVNSKLLNKLKAQCKKVLEERQAGVESTLLPPQEGFFFGGYGRDAWYYDSLEKTIEICDRALKADMYLYYTSSW